jgi:acyl-CoA synthetase (AMP-forming)/AMP-acid ligase II
MKRLVLILMICFLFCSAKVYAQEADTVLTISIPNSVAVEVIEAFCVVNTYTGTTVENDVIVSQTKAEFMEQEIKEHIQKVHESYKVNIGIASLDTIRAEAEKATKDITVTTATN